MTPATHPCRIKNGRLIEFALAQGHESQIRTKPPRGVCFLEKSTLEAKDQQLSITKYLYRLEIRSGTSAERSQQEGLLISPFRAGEPDRARVALASTPAPLFA
jgi:hypothetical protein